MRCKLFGRSGLRVSELCLGAMTFGEEWGFGASKEECRKMVDAFAAAGGNFIDTANRYTEGMSEIITGECIASNRGRWVLATKYTLSSDPTDPNASGNHRKNLVQALDASLKRLKTDYIDLYWVHAWDFVTPVEEIMRALDDAVRSGKVLYVGVSDAPAWTVSRANTLAELKGWTAFTGLQIQYSLIERTPERDLLPMARALDLAVTPWGVLGSGMLTGKYQKEADAAQAQNSRLNVTPWGPAYLQERNFAIAAEVKKVAAEIGRTPSQVALAWVRRKPGVVIPILGARSMAQLKDNLGCLEFALDDEHLARLDDASRIDLGFPHEFLNTDFVRTLVYGNLYAALDRHREHGE